MGIEKKAALVCVIVLAALFGIGLATSGENQNTETAKARAGASEETPSGFILPEAGSSKPLTKQQPKAEPKGLSGPQSEPSSEGSGFREVVVRARDNYTKIAARELGSRNLHALITAANPGVDPRRLQVGQKIRVPVDLKSAPEGETVSEQLPSLGGLEYTIKNGESLSVIANRVYGKESKWRDIWAANRGSIPNPNRVRSGITIVLP